MQLTGKQKRHLRGLGHHLHPIVQIGKGGTTESLTQEVERALDDHELIKIRTLESCEEEIKNAAARIARDAKADTVQILGRTALLFRRRKENPIIEFPR